MFKGKCFYPLEAKKWSEDMAEPQQMDAEKWIQSLISKVHEQTQWTKLQQQATAFASLAYGRLWIQAHQSFELGKQSFGFWSIFSKKENLELSTASWIVVAKEIAKSALFDPAYYLQQYPDVRLSGVDPLTHFVLYGVTEKRNPNPFFDVEYYLQQNPDVAEAKINPLYHFICYGWKEGRKPHPRFDPAFYLHQYKDVAEAGMNPLSHYLLFGQLEGRIGSPEEEPLNDPQQRILLNGSLIEIEDWYPYGFSPSPRWGYDKPVHPILYSIIKRSEDHYRSLLTDWVQFADDLLSFPLRDNGSELDPCWENSSFPPLDAIALFGIIATTKPALFLEIGSGFTTRWAYGAKVRYSPLTKLVSIDPSPRVNVDTLCQQAFRRPLHELPLDIFEQLEAGDILFVDGTHRILQGSDATIFFLEILPIVKAGVIIHLHDIFLPFDYPPHWQKKYYSEQYVLGSILLVATEKYRILFPSFYVSQHQELLKILDQLWTNPKLQSLKPKGGSFWFVKR
ncbi:class I SAM-dependent methyltransferase [Methylacidiphilum sp. Yel]|uniref:class I SAM-dependent methyltransferase n=1 Tax=Methylacidiphilum sp. Yel TaxID=1847730 RepID=UPI001068F6D5|nr:class I SAM-dependent methyltransferase [Methylacidiphilum sp. Yel]